MHKPRIKFGEVRDLTTARYAASAMADWIGFSFDPENENFINPLDAKTIIDWIAGPAFVGEFGYQDAEHINQLADMLKLDYVQVPADAKPEIISAISKPLIIKGAADTGKAEWVLSDAVMEGNCIFNCSELSDRELELIRRDKPAAIELKGRKETATGIADLDPLNRFLEDLELI